MGLLGSILHAIIHAADNPHAPYDTLRPEHGELAENRGKVRADLLSH